MAIQKVCGFCEKAFLVPNRRSEAVKYCSIPCSSAARRVTLKCATCDNAFSKKLHRADSLYCSRSCYHASRVGVARTVKDPKRYYKTCEGCAVKFRVTLTRKDSARWCSRVCENKSPVRRAQKSEVQSGNKSSLWKGGRYVRGTGYVRERGAGISSKTFRFEHRLVMERAMLDQAADHPFLIEADGIKRLDRKIEVHHRDLNRSNNDFSNLLAVTKQAHARIHHKNKRPEPWECWPYSHSEIIQEASQMQGTQC